jgi:HK97 family phage portal protein
MSEETQEAGLGPTEVAAIEASFTELIPLEGPSHLKGLDLTNGGQYLLGADYRSTKSGVSINTRSALEISAVQSCATLVAEDVGKLPCHLYLWDTGRKTAKKAVDHPYYRLITERPNPDMTAQAFRETLTLHAMLTGGGYAWKARDDKGRVAELWPLVPGSCVPMRETGGENKGDLYYDVWFEDGSHESVWPDRILRLTGISWDGISGLNRVTLAREILGLSMRISQAQAKFYGKDLRPSGIVSTTEKVSSDIVDRVQASWQKQFGPDGQGGVAVLSHGFDFKPMAISSKDADSIALWRFLIEEACRIFRVQPLKVMHATGTQSYASVDVLNQAHLTDTLDPWLVRWEQETQRDLLDEEDQDLFVKFNRGAFLRPLIKDRYEVYTKARQANLMKVNEIRELEELDRIDDLRADDVFAPIGTNPMPAAVTPKPPPAAAKPAASEPAVAAAAQAKPQAPAAGAFDSPDEWSKEDRGQWLTIGAIERLGARLLEAVAADEAAGRTAEANDGRELLRRLGAYQARIAREAAASPS